MIRRAAAYIVLVSIYGVTWLVSILGGMIPRRAWNPTGRIMVTGTFHNPNWYLSHVTPLSRCGLKEVILIVDEPQLPLDRVRFVCPPKWVSKILSRAGAKALWMIIAGRRYRPDLYMGYHIAPGACSALVAGKLLGRPACYQMTAGPVEIAGGGFEAAESVGHFLGRPSRLIESMAWAVVNRFHLVVVRGNNARRFLEAHHLKASVAIITGSVNGDPPLHQVDRGIHLVSVGRLAPAKQVDQFLQIVEAVARVLPSVRAAIVGDGPLLEDLESQANGLGLARNVEFLGKRKDVPAILAQSRVFVLTSQSEGLSIAMIEAMAAGAVPVVADVGELGDLVANGVTGYLVPPNRVDEYANRVLSLLQDDALWTQCSHKAAEMTRGYCGIDVITEKWARHIQDVVSRASGRRVQGALN